MFDLLHGSVLEFLHFVVPEQKVTKRINAIGIEMAGKGVQSQISISVKDDKNV